jgi:hypothetical protein
VVAFGSLAVAAAALVVAVVALGRANNRPAPPGVLSDASIVKLRSQLGHRKLTRDDVREILGSPASIYRDNPRAECWAYEAPGGGSGREQPYEVTMCFGPKRHLAWLAYGGPRRLRPPA